MKEFSNNLRIALIGKREDCDMFAGCLQWLLSDQSAEAVFNPDTDYFEDFVQKPNVDKFVFTGVWYDVCWRPIPAFMDSIKASHAIFNLIEKDDIIVASSQVPVVYVGQINELDLYYHPFITYHYSTKGISYTEWMDKAVELLKEFDIE